MRTYTYSYPVTYSSAVILKHGDESKKGEWVHWKGYVVTKYGIVKVESSITPFLSSKKCKTSFLKIAWNGIEYNRNWDHYKIYTAVGLARVAGNFAKEIAKNNPL